METVNHSVEAATPKLRQAMEFVVGHPLGEHQSLVVHVLDAASHLASNGGNSFLAAAEAVGIVGAIGDGPSDLSTNKAHMNGFGRG